MEEDTRKLYPLRFIDEGEDKSWGHVDYHVADLGFKDSMVSEGWFGGNTLSELMNTYLERVVGDDVFEFYGLQFPVMMKVMTVNAWQPLQVNPSDEVAAERYDSLGKTALWYVQKSEPDSLLYLGFNRDVDASEFYRRCEDNTVTEILNPVHPHTGDAFLINPGTVFAAGPGLKIVEISESSELAFTIHNWGQILSDTEEIMLEEAFDIIDFGKYEPEPLRGDTLASCPEFKVTKMNLSNPLHIFSEQPGSFALYYCASGEASVQVPSEGPDGKGMDAFEVKAGHTILVPSELNDIYLVPTDKNTVVLETLVDKRTVHDDYTGEDVTPDALGVDVPDPHEKEW